MYGFQTELSAVGSPWLAPSATAKTTGKPFATAFRETLFDSAAQVTKSFEPDVTNIGVNTFAGLG